MFPPGDTSAGSVRSPRIGTGAVIARPIVPSLPARPYQVPTPWRTLDSSTKRAGSRVDRDEGTARTRVVKDAGCRFVFDDARWPRRSSEVHARDLTRYRGRLRKVQVHPRLLARG